MPEFSDNPVVSRTSNTHAVEGVSEDGRGLVGRSDTNYGIRGHSRKSAGIRGSSDEGRGIEGVSNNWEAIVGVSKTSTGVWGQTEGAGIGVAGSSKTGSGVEGTSTGGRGVVGRSSSSTGVEGWSETGEGIHAETKSLTLAALAAYTVNPTGTGSAIYGESRGRGPAAYFKGNVDITGNLIVQGVSIQTLLQRIAQLEQQTASVAQFVQRISSLEQKVTALENQLKTAGSNLNGRITQTEVAISDLKSKVQQIIAHLGG